MSENLPAPEEPHIERASAWAQECHDPDRYAVRAAGRLL